MDDRIDLRRFFSIVYRRAFLIVATAICFALLTAVLTIYVIKPTFEAREYIIVGKQVETETQEFYRKLASSMDLIKSPIVLGEVSKTAPFTGETLKTLEDKIAVQNNKDSQILNIIVRDSDKEYARELALRVADVSAAKMNSLLEVKVKNESGGADASIKQVGSSILNIAIGTAAGLFFGILLAMLREYLDDSVRGESEIEDYFQLPLLGEVNLKKKENRRTHSEKYVSNIQKTRGGEVGV
ncbi:YveK family protein [Fictibacillus aquaticus]|uniref:Polysaccharide chain length determinant N-terminal domain-containing protein n=1 Tax=Fictibacillus aquaticus TaxID=2021314 RepID=A0A235F9T3_9BACL|nr:Wzz/FepE/Etk N-terminal domain-containing protein [Fictibacillus aquaticus]OYD57717.1 hypothetical protein CGZ90_13720 [Fictibacillus aquaticus]